MNMNIWRESGQYLVPHERKDEEVERPSLSCHEDEEVPESRATVDPVADLADAARHSRPFQRQLSVEARHQHFDAQKRLCCFFCF